MDAKEAQAQLKAAQATGRALGNAATNGWRARLGQLRRRQERGQVDRPVRSGQGGQACRQRGRAAGPQVTQAAKPGSEPVEAFSAPAIVLDTPSTAVFATEAGAALFAGSDMSFVAQGDIHQTAAHTWSAVSGKTSSWYAHQGGIKVYAANGPVSLRAHTDELQIWADKEVTVISVNDEITISAQTKIELIAGQSSVTLEGSDVEFKTPGAFTAKGATKAFLGGSGIAAGKVELPDSRMKIFHERFQALDKNTGSPVAGLLYRITLADGTILTGKTDEFGKTEQVATADSQAVSLHWEPEESTIERPDDTTVEGC